MRTLGPCSCILIPAFCLELDHDAEESPQLELEFPSADPGPDVLLQTKQEEGRLRSFVRGLTTPNRDIVQRRYWDEQSQADIARSLKVSEAAISKRLRRVISAGRLALGDLKFTD